MKIGVLGGTFDPIHYGHLVVAEEVWAKLGLQQVLFVPAGQPPHKLRRAVSPAADRAAMVDLAIATNPHFALSRIDLDRPGPSYSVETVAELRRAYGAESELHFIIGLDSLADLITWHQPAKLAELCRLVAVTRPGCTWYDLASLEPAIPRARERIQIVDVPQFDIASSELRRRVAEGRPITYQVPREVERYIYERAMYRNQESRAGSFGYGEESGEQDEHRERVQE